VGTDERRWRKRKRRERTRKERERGREKEREREREREGEREREREREHLDGGGALGRQERDELFDAAEREDALPPRLAARQVPHRPGCRGPRARRAQRTGAERASLEFQFRARATAGPRTCRCVGAVADWCVEDPHQWL